MSTQREDIRFPDKRLAAVCGLFCPACTVFIGTGEDPERLQVLARRFDEPVDELQCNGCKSERRCFYCKEICMMKKCAEGKGLDFYGECHEYPCEDLKKFQTEAPHRIELRRSHERIKETGYETWYKEMIDHYACPECQTLNSVKCRKCGNEPSCEYVSRHRETIMKHLTKR